MDMCCSITNTANVARFHINSYYHYTKKVILNTGNMEGDAPEVGTHLPCVGQGSRRQAEKICYHKKNLQATPA